MEDQLKKLLEGNQRFVKGLISVESMISVKKMHDLAENGQRPKSIILTCSDSRAPAEIIFDQGVGELFVVRVAGNVVAPSLIASMEFAAANFGCSLLMVLGHTKCGAVQAALHYCSHPHEVPPSQNLTDLVNRISPAAKKAQLENNSLNLMSLATHYNVESSIAAILQESSILRSLVEKKELQIVGAILDIHTGQVSILDSSLKRN
jgi:carbonic anhydrase